MRAFSTLTKINKRMIQIAAGAAVATTVLVALPTPAQAAFPPSPRDVHRRVTRDVRRVLELPRAIHRAHVDAFRSFYHGRSYYPSHHHYHTTYRFPVYYGNRVVYRPYSYCNDSLIIGRGVPVPRIVVNVRPGGYYGPPPPVYYRERCNDCDDRRYGDRNYDHDRYDNDRDYDHDRYDHDRDYDRHDRDDYDDDHGRYDDDDR